MDVWPPGMAARTESARVLVPDARGNVTTSRPPAPRRPPATTIASYREFARDRDHGIALLDDSTKGFFTRIPDMDPPSSPRWG